MAHLLILHCRTYDNKQSLVALDVAPRFMIRDALKARDEINKLLLSYYQPVVKTGHAFPR